MKTFVSCSIKEILEQQTLSPLNLQKVCIITDMSKNLKLMNAEPLPPHEFDELYDMDIERLESIQYRVQLAAESYIRWKRYTTTSGINGDGDAD